METIYTEYKDPEMRDSALNQLIPPSKKSAIERDFLLTKQGLFDGKLRGKITFFNGVKDLINNDGIHNLPLSYQWLAYLAATANQSTTQKELAVSKIRHHVDTFCAPFKAEEIANFKASNIKDLAKQKFTQYVAAACFSYVSGQADLSEGYLSQAVNEAVIFPKLLTEILPVKDQETGGYNHGKTSLRWFLNKTKTELNINIEE